MASHWTRALLAAAVTLTGLTAHMPLAQAQLQAITVPFRPHDLNIPHPAYNGHPTRFKAIARGVPASCASNTGRVYFHWDIDGDNVWDECPNRPAAERVADPPGLERSNYWYRATDRYLLDCLRELPYVDRDVTPKKLFIATIEVACSIDAQGNGVDGVFDTYPVMVFADVPRGRPALTNPAYYSYAYSARPPVANPTCTGKCSGTNNACHDTSDCAAGQVCNGTCNNAAEVFGNGTGSPCNWNAECEGDTPDTLKVKRDVSIEDALWYLHGLLTRSGEGTNNITAWLYNGNGTDYRLAGAGAYLWGLTQNGHLPAYPPGTYVHGDQADRTDLPAGWATENNNRYNEDPLAEDAVRLLNYLLSTGNGRVNLHDCGATCPSEANNGLAPIPGTDDKKGYYNSGSYVMGHVLGAIATSGMGGTTCQVVPCTGYSIEWMVQELVDGACDYQNKGGYDDGGWRYGYRDATDGSTAQWMLIGLEAADRSMSKHKVIVANECRNRVANHLVHNPYSSYNQNHTGTSHFTGSGRYVNGCWSNRCPPPGRDMPLTGGLLVGHGWLGTSELPANDNVSFTPENTHTNNMLRYVYDRAMKYIGDNWEVVQPSGVDWNGNNWKEPKARFDGLGNGSVYTLYSVQKGLRTLPKDKQDFVPTTAGGQIDWFRDYSYFFINNQHRDGFYVQRWCDYETPGCNHVGATLSTGWGTVLVLTPTLFDPDPVAVGNAEPMEIAEGCQGGDFGKVTFTHSGSYHLSPPPIEIEDYQWLFDVGDPPNPDWRDDAFWEAIPDNGYSLDKKAFHTSSRDNAAVYTYLSAGTYNAALRVVDKHGKTNVYFITGIKVTAQDEVPPTANAGGPYVITEGDDLTLAGTAHDLNVGCKPGQTLSAAWFVLKGGQWLPLYDQAAGVVDWDAVLADLDLPHNQPIDIKLVVEDSTGRAAPESFSQLTVYDRNPIACFTMLPPAIAGCSSPVTVDGSCSTHVDYLHKFIQQYEWQWDSLVEYQAGDDPTLFPFHVDAVGPQLSHTYLQPGSYRITLRVTDNAGAQAIAQQVVTISPMRPPNAVAGGPYAMDTWLENGVRVGGQVLLDGSASSDPDEGTCGDALTSWLWDVNGDNVFGDKSGETAVLTWAELQPLLAGLRPEQYLADPLTGQPRLNVVLRVADSSLPVPRTHDSLTSLTIYHDGPYARFSLLPSRAACNQVVTFDASASYHGHPLHSIVQWQWDFDNPGAALGDLAEVKRTFVADRQGVRTIQWRYDGFRTYYPVLRVIDDRGREDFAFGPDVVVDLGNSPPQVDAGGPYELTFGSLLALDGTGTIDVDLPCDDSIVSYEWDLNGDGQFTEAVLDEAPQVPWERLTQILAGPPAVPYPADPRTGLPSITIGLRVTDSFGASAIGTATLTIYPRNPVAVAHWAPQPFVQIDSLGRATVQLDGSGSYPSNPNTPLVSWSWSLRGSAQSIPGRITSMTLDLNPLPNPIPAEGIKKWMTLRVTDTANNTGSTDFEVAFNRQPSQPPIIVFDVGRDGIYIEQGEGFSLSAAGTTDPDGDPFNRVAWDVNGDGVDDIVWQRLVDGGAPPWQLLLNWLQMGGYPGLRDLGVHQIRLTVTDSTGATATDTVPLTILEHAMNPVAKAVPMSAGCQSWFGFDGAESRHLFPGHQVTSWRWDVDGDGLFDLAGPQVDYRFGAFGTFPVLLEVGDLLGHTATATVTVSTTDGNIPPVAHPGGPYFADSKLKNGLVLDASGSTAPTEEESCGDYVMTYRWDLDNVLVDGQRVWEVVTDQPIVQLPWSEIQGLPQGSVNHHILLEVEDSLGGTTQAETTLLIADGSPVASFVVVPEVSACGQPMSFDATSSYHPAGGQIVSYAWDFDYQEGGDFVASDQHLGEKVFQRTFEQGSWQVALKVTDAQGRFSIVWHGVRVSEDNLPPIPRTNGNVNGAVGQDLLLDASTSMDPNAGCGDSIVAYEWDLDNNGVYEIGPVPAVYTLPKELVAQYPFDIADVFTQKPDNPIHLRVTDELGAQGVLATTLRMFDGAPRAVPAVRPAVAGCGGELVLDGSGSYPGVPGRRLTLFTWDLDPAVDSDGDGDPDNDPDRVGGQVNHHWDRMILVDGVAQPRQVALTVTDEHGAKGTALVGATLSFENFRPTANHGGPYVTTMAGEVSAPINLDGSASHDANLPCDEIVRYAWDTDNDGVFGLDDVGGPNSHLCGATDCEGETVRVQGTTGMGWRVGRAFPIALKVQDYYGRWSSVAETTIQISSSVPPAVVLLSPVGGEVLRGTAPVSFRVAHPLGEWVDLEMYLNDVPLAFNGDTSVNTNDDGSFLDVQRTFDTTAEGIVDARDYYRLKVVARLRSEPTLFGQSISRSTFSIDNTPPEVIIPDQELAVTKEQASWAGTAFTFTATARDNLDPAPVLARTPALVSYPLGPTTVVFTATDWAGNTSSRQATVLIEDTQPPTLLPGVDITTEATRPAGTPVLFSPSAWDACDASVDITNNGPPDGFPVGDTLVTFTAVDKEGNRTQGTLTVHITDGSPPRALLPDPPRLNVNQTEPRGVPSSLALVQPPNPDLVDNGWPPASITCSYTLTLRDAAASPVTLADVLCGTPLPEGLFYPPGETVITYRLEDGSQNVGWAFFTVMVVDTMAPVVTLGSMPPSDVWLTEPAVVSFRVNDASDPDPEVDVQPVPGGVLPPPDEQGNYVITYAEDGVYDVRIYVRDDGGNESVIILNRFGIDRSGPTSQVTQFPTEGVGLEQESSWPLVFAGEEFSPRFTVTDDLSGVKNVDVRVVPGQPGQPILVLQRSNNLVGSPATGPHVLANLACQDQADVCSAGKLSLWKVAQGNQHLLVTARDGVDNSSLLDVPFKVITLADALVLVRERLATYLQQGGLAEAQQELVRQADGLLAAGQLSLHHGYLGGCLLSIEDAVKKMTDADLLLAQPELNEDARLLARGAYSETRLYWKEKGSAGVDGEKARNFLAQAADFIYVKKLYNMALIAAENAYFYARNAEVPFSAPEIVSSVSLLEQIIDEMYSYLDLADLPGYDEVTMAWQMMVAPDVEAALETLGDTGSLAGPLYIRMLLALQDLALGLTAAEDQGVWVRNWQWGIAQIIRVLIDIARLDAYYYLPPTHCKVVEAEEQYDIGMAWLDDREVDYMLDLYAEHDIRCLMLQIYIETGAYVVNFTLEQYGCQFQPCPE